MKAFYAISVLALKIKNIFNKKRNYICSDENRRKGIQQEINENRPGSLTGQVNRNKDIWTLRLREERRGDKGRGRETRGRKGEVIRRGREGETRGRKR